LVTGSHLNVKPGHRADVLIPANADAACLLPTTTTFHTRARTSDLFPASLSPAAAPCRLSQEGDVLLIAMAAPSSMSARRINQSRVFCRQQVLTGRKKKRERGETRRFTCGQTKMSSVLRETNNLLAQSVCCHHLIASFMSPSPSTGLLHCPVCSLHLLFPSSFSPITPSLCLSSSSLPPSLL